jgi:DNA polymerase III delta prime subunit
MADRINFICAQEGLTLQPGVMGTLGTAAGGDMRKAITILQSSSRLYGATSPPHRGCVYRTLKHRLCDPPSDKALAAQLSQARDPARAPWLGR